MIKLGYLAWLVPAMMLIAGCSKHPPPLTEQGKKTVSELISNLKPRCVGRYLIDVPDDASSAGNAIIQGVVFETKQITADEFTQEMAVYETNLRSKKNSHGYRVLYDYGQVPNTPHSRYFVTLRDLDDSDDLRRTIEAYKWDAGYQIKLRIEASDWVNSVYKTEVQNTPYAVPDLKINDVPEKVRLVLDLAASVRGRQDKEIPAEPGVCFKDGFLPRRAAAGEDVSVLFALKDRPDVFFELRSNTDLRESKKNSLPNRLPQIKTELKESNGKIIRAEPVTVSDIEADELLVSATTAAGVPGHFFRLEANTTISGSTTPHLVLEMGNGGLNSFTADHLEKASLTESEAIALWDVVSRTLRARPSGF